jgi:hypothetical protein
MRVAWSASYFNCPPVAALLHSCDIVYTTNDYALANFAHKDIRAMSTRPPGSPPSDVEVIHFTDLFRLFNAWAANATTGELDHWHEYFKTTDADEIRKRAGEISQGLKDIANKRVKEITDNKPK